MLGKFAGRRARITAGGVAVDYIVGTEALHVLSTGHTIRIMIQLDRMECNHTPAARSEPGSDAALMWGGGPWHPFPDIRRAIEGHLQSHGLELTYTESSRVFAAPSLMSSPLVIFAGLHWSGLERLGNDTAVDWDPPESATTTYRPLADAELAGLVDYVAEGGALLCQHPGLASFGDDRPELADLFDGRYITGVNEHTEDWTEPVVVSIVEPHHPITSGLQDFAVFDELYHGFVEPGRSTVLLAGRHLEMTAPLAWVREERRGRIAVCLIGHDMRAYNAGGFQAFFERLIRWLLRKL